MRNLKRALSLALASVMLLGMMVVGTSASYPDVTYENNEEAIEVLKAVGVMTGDEKGNFNPDKAVTRNEMAVIMTALLDLKTKDYAGSCPLTDVPAWAEPYVAACYANGIVSGTSATTYSGDATVTAAQAALMMQKALGYFQYSSDFGDDWMVATVKQASKIDLFKGIDVSATAPLTRNDVAQLALNTLKATMVDAEDNGIGVNADGQLVSKYKYVEVTKTNPSNDQYTAIKAGTPVDSKYTVELGEELYDGDLVLDATTSVEDAFGRPCKTWKYEDNDVFAVVDDAKAVFTGSASTSDVVDALKGYKFNGTELKNKDTVASSDIENTDIVGLPAKIDTGDTLATEIKGWTANGKVVEFYANDSKEITEINVITYTVAKVTNVTTNKKGDVTYAISGLGNKVDYADDDANTDTIAVEGTVAKNDYVLYVQDVNEATLYHVYAATKISGQQTATDGTSLTISGTKYKLGKGVTAYDGNNSSYTNSSKEANYYLDQFGYVVASSDVEADLVYAVVNKIAAKNTTTGLDTGKSAEAELILADGTKVTVDVSKINDLKVTDNNFTVGDTVTLTLDANGKATAVEVSETVATNGTLFAGRIVSYTVDDGKYELTYAASDSSVSAATGHNLTNKGVPAFGYVTTKSATTSTTYVVKTENSSGDEVINSYVGFANVPTIAANGATLTAKYVMDDNKVVFVYIDATANSSVGESTTENIFYVTNATVTTNGTGSDKYYTVNGILDGVKTTIQSKVADFKVVTGSAAMTEDTFYTLSINEEGYVTSAVTTSFSANGTADQALVDGIADGSFAGYLIDNDTEIFVIDGDEVTEGAAESIAVNDHWYVTLPSTGTAAEKNTIDTLYIVVAD